MDQHTAKWWQWVGVFAVCGIALATPEHAQAGATAKARERGIQARDLQDATVRAALRAVNRTTVPVPVEVVGSLEVFSDEVARQIRAADACAFVLTPRRDRMYVLTSCNDFVAARDGSRLGMLRLAAVIEHEIAHIEGADEIGALEAQLRAAERFQRFSTTTAEMLTPFLLYRTALKRRIAGVTAASDMHPSAR